MGVDIVKPASKHEMKAWTEADLDRIVPLSMEEDDLFSSILAEIAQDLDDAELAAERNGTSVSDHSLSSVPPSPDSQFSEMYTAQCAYDDVEGEADWIVNGHIVPPTEPPAKRRKRCVEDAKSVRAVQPCPSCEGKGWYPINIVYLKNEKGLYEFFRAPAKFKHSIEGHKAACGNKTKEAMCCCAPPSYERYTPLAPSDVGFLARLTFISGRRAAPELARLAALLDLQCPGTCE